MTPSSSSTIDILGLGAVTIDDLVYVESYPPADAKVRVRFERENRFMVTIGTRITHVHQGDPTSIRDDGGTIHQIILRRYRDKPNDRTPARAQPGTADSSTVVARLPDGVDDASRSAAPPEPAPPEPPQEGQGA